MIANDKGNKAMIANDKELDARIEELDNLLEKVVDLNNPTKDEEEYMSQINALADIIEEYETRTDILNRPLEG